MSKKAQKSSRQRPCPLRRSAPALPKGEPLAGRATSYWTLKARYGAKGRALLQRAAASGQYPLSSCRESRQRSTPVSEKIRLCSSRVGLTGTPVPLPLGEVASRSDDGEGKPVSREPPHSDKQVLWQSDAIAAPALLRQHPCPLRRSAPALPEGEPKGILPDGFSPFTQETGRFAQVLLIFFRRCGIFKVT